MEFQVENIKCGGCANGIRKQLEAMDEVETVTVDVEAGCVRLSLAPNIKPEGSVREKIAQTLLKMGYPESGTVEGLKAAGAKAKSFVSCAVGKMSD
ncbi:heavy-metal-associated domain-containing protein [Thiomicrorhabdus indica]|nr:heavy-metal-associated domain-containing protein [Thiomicrorhabdus indica]